MIDHNNRARKGISGNESLDFAPLKDVTRYIGASQALEVLKVFQAVMVFVRQHYKVASTSRQIRSRSSEKDCESTRVNSMNLACKSSLILTVCNRTR